MPSVSEFLIERLKNAGVDHVFGVTGEYISSLFKKMAKSEQISVVRTADETGAGFAADAYARLKGVGCVCVTYNVGALKLVNVIAGAYAERSPVILISGSPGAKEQVNHMVKTDNAQRHIFDNITCASVVLDNPNTAGYEIDKAIELMHFYKQPIYIELPRDVAEKPIAYDVYKQGTPDAPKSDEQNLEEALIEATAWLSEATNPVILAGVELARFNIGSKLMKFAERTNIPIASTLLSKSTIPEHHPLYLGVYAGATSLANVQQAVESADCLLMLGVISGDVALNSLQGKLQKKHVIASTVDSLHIKNHEFKDVQFADFTQGILRAEIGRKTHAPISKKTREKFVRENKKKLTTARFFEKMDSIIDDTHVVIADSGDCLVGACDLTIYNRDCFLGGALYTSMGSAIPGALGAGLARPNDRTIVLVGDGAFQMSASELSTIAARRLKPIVIVLNNKGYITERLVLDGEFNDIPNWNYENVVDMIGSGVGIKVETEDELETALKDALEGDQLYVINVVVDSNDMSPALKRLKVGIRKA